MNLVCRLKLVYYESFGCDNVINKWHDKNPKLQTCNMYLYTTIHACELISEWLVNVLVGDILMWNLQVLYDGES